LNASGAGFQATDAGFFVNPVRQIVDTTPLTFNYLTGEIGYTSSLTLSTLKVNNLISPINEYSINWDLTSNVALVNKSQVQSVSATLFNGGAWSVDSYSGGAFVSAKAGQLTGGPSFGFSFTPYFNSDTNIQFGFACGSDGISIYANGVYDGGVYATYTTSDVLSLTFDGTTYRYFKNDTEIHSVVSANTNPHYFYSAFYFTNSYIYDIKFGPNALTNVHTREVSKENIVSTINGLGSFGYVSSLVSTLDGLGDFGYVSTLSLTSTLDGLGDLGYVSSLSLTSTVEGLSELGYISTASLTSSIEGLGTTLYISSLSLISTVEGLGESGFFSSLSLVSTVEGLGTSGFISTTMARTNICQAKLTTNQTIQSTLDTVVQYVDDIDPNNWWNSGTYQFQPTIPGYYLINACVWWAAGDSNITNQTNIQLRKNGAGQGISQAPIFGQTGNTQSITRLLQLNGTSDYIDVTVYTGNSGTQDIQASGGSVFTATLQ
jgi:hypothetical protein